MIDSSTAMNRPDHQVCAIAPRVLRAFSPPSTARGRDAGGHQGPPRWFRRRSPPSVTDGLRGQLEHPAQLAVGQLRQPALAVADHEVGEGLLLLDHLVDLLLQGAGADELAHLHVALLPIRKARSVAWFSTAGFHHRSRWITWLAAVRFSPVPPARSDRRNSGGPSPDWNLVTRSSRRFFDVPPCK